MWYLITKGFEVSSCQCLGLTLNLLILLFWGGNLGIGIKKKKSPGDSNVWPDLDLRNSEIYLYLAIN